eukprot:gene5815-8021_t
MSQSISIAVFQEELKLSVTLTKSNDVTANMIFSLSYENFTWKVTRNWEDLYQFAEGLALEYPTILPFPEQLKNDDGSVMDKENIIQNYFKILFNVLGENLWNNQILSLFDDSTTESTLNKVQLHRMSQQIKSLQSSLSNVESSFSVTIDKLFGMIQTLSEQISYGKQFSNSSYPLTATNLAVNGSQTQQTKTGSEKEYESDVTSVNDQTKMRFSHHRGSEESSLDPKLVETSNNLSYERSNFIGVDSNASHQNPPLSMDPFFTDPAEQPDISSPLYWEPIEEANDMNYIEDDDGNRLAEPSDTFIQSGANKVLNKPLTDSVLEFWEYVEGFQTSGSVDTGNGSKKGWSNAAPRTSHTKIKKILIVDDSATNRKIINRLLKDRIPIRDEACDGQEAVDKFLESVSSGQPYDVIMMDNLMPVMNGPDATNKIRSLGYEGLIIGVTGSENLPELEMFNNSGANKVLQKPLNITNFMDLINNIGPVTNKIKKMLIVDDAATNRKMVNHLLKDLIPIRDEACDGNEAIQKYLEAERVGQPYEVIIMDNFMPTKSGPDATREIRALGFQGVIIGVTGSDYQTDLDIFKSSGINQVLEKPLNINAFIDVITNKEEIETFVNSCVDEIVQLLQPHMEQFQYRSSAVNMIKYQTRESLNSSVFEIGLHELKCFLPDDSMKLSVVISKTNMIEWHKQLMEQLHIVAEQAVSGAGLAENTLDLPDEISKTVTNHVISNICFTNHLQNFKVLFTIDSLNIEIIPNCRADLCMLAFFEEFGNLVDQDYLFKRSILLIRAWWTYETAGYLGSPINHYIPEMAFVMMICAIFNLNHNRISTPLHALNLFISEYSKFDCINYAITLQGPVPFVSEVSNQPLVMELIPPDHLIDSQFLDKYWQAYNLVGMATKDPQSNQFVNMQNEELNSYYRQDMKKIALLSTFERSAFSVVHPFNYSNMIQESLSLRRYTKIASAFQSGSHSLNVIQNALRDTNLQKSNLKTSIRSFFPEVINRFDKTWRPDAIGNSIVIVKSLSRNLMNSSLERKFRDIQYFDLILESIVSESAILTITLEILNDRGPLPVGEIGKILTELSSNPNLSQKLKESFGGLKKFVEKYPEHFVIFNDHPFNPHVLLRQTLSQQQLMMIDKGVFPTQLMIKSKKIMPKKKKPTSITPSIPGSQTLQNPNINQMTTNGPQLTAQVGMNGINGNVNINNNMSYNNNNGISSNSSSFISRPAVSNPDQTLVLRPDVQPFNPRGGLDIISQQQYKSNQIDHLTSKVSMNSLNMNNNPNLNRYQQSQQTIIDNNNNNMYQQNNNLSNNMNQYMNAPPGIYQNQQQMIQQQQQQQMQRNFQQQQQVMPQTSRLNKQYEPQGVIGMGIPNISQYDNNIDYIPQPASSTVDNNRYGSRMLNTILPVGVMSSTGNNNMYGPNIVGNNQSMEMMTMQQQQQQQQQQQSMDRLQLDNNEIYFRLKQQQQQQNMPGKNPSYL